MKSKRKYIIIVLVLLFFLFITFVAGFGIGKYSNKLSRIKSMIDLLFVLDYNETYVEDIAAKAMVRALNDPYSEYMTEEETISFTEELEGQYKGIGVSLFYNEEKEEAEIKSVEEGGPAERAGIKNGDILLSADGIEMSRENYERIIYYIRGISEEAPEDSKEMTLVIRRGEEKMNIKIKRENFSTEAVTTDVKDGIAYIKLREFSSQAAIQFEDAIKSINGEKGLILDLRDNGGGSVTSLIDIAEHILPPCVLITMENANGDMFEYRIEDSEYFDAPLAVLVNENTASASEVLSAAVKETGRGYLIGKTTYGKGLVQNIIPLGDGSAIRLTVEKYYTSAGHYINGVGVRPNITEENENDQMLKAIEYVKKRIN